jgi:acyl-CoA reductase-like NAD-dependent aldehyde dehydrogenase
MSIIIDGWIGGTSPFDGSPLARVRASSETEIRAVVEQARASQAEWAGRSVAERARIVKRAGQHLMSHADEVAQVLHTELGKPLTETYAVDLGSAPEVFRYYVRHAARLLRSEKVHFNPIMFPRKRAVVDRVPHGVVALLTPWNYPISIPLHNLVPALLAGNAVILKPSEYACRSGAILHRLLAEKLPAGLFGLVQGDGVAGEALIRTGVDHLVFVGGVVGGRAVARTAADNLTPVALELGGNDAAIVLEDADLDRAAHGIAWAGFLNAGQSCAGVERIYVVEAVAAPFTAKLAAIAQKLRLGDDAAQPGRVDLGPLSTDHQLNVVKRHVEEALARGATLHWGGESALAGRFYRPTILTGVNSEMEVMQAETFGPVVPIQVVANEAEAIREANRGNYGLTGSVWTRDLKRGERVARQLQVGVATVNNHMFSGAAPQAPWAGRGLSGYGVQNSKLALYSLTRPRLVAVDAHRTPRELWWFPYDQALLDLGRGMLATRGRFLDYPRRWLLSYLRMLRGVAMRLIIQRKR